MKKRKADMERPQKRSQVKNACGKSLSSANEAGWVDVKMRCVIVLDGLAALDWKRMKKSKSNPRMRFNNPL